MSRVDPAYLTGQSEGHLCSPAEAEGLGALVHADTVASLAALRDAAAEAGFELEILSGFRGFRRQASIWNRKASGTIPVLDSLGVAMDIGRLSERDLVFAILRWSALPGASRHHWGTDVDVFDAKARPPGYEVELIPAEVDPGGMFGPLHAWLDDRIAAGASHGFFRPYDRDREGVAPERWHLSHGPVASAYEEHLTAAVLRATIVESALALKDTVLESLDEIYERFVTNTCRWHG
jgi:LAS superfamily LD-carboxypeptidase LdcB